MSTFHATDLLIPPENIRKTEVQGVSKEICGMKWVNRVNLTLVSDIRSYQFQ